MARSIARGGQAPIPEPPFALPPGPVLRELPAQDLIDLRWIDPRWAAFVTRHEHLHAAAAAAEPEPTLLDPPSPDLILLRSPLQQAMVPGTPSRFSRMRKLLWWNAPRGTAATTRAPQSLRFRLQPKTPAQEPLVVQGHQPFCMHRTLGQVALRCPQTLTVVPLRTACGVFLGVAAQFSDQPRGDICRRPELVASTEPQDEVRHCVFHNAERIAVTAW